MVDFFYVEYVIYFASEVIVNVLLGAKHLKKIKQKSLHALMPLTFLIVIIFFF